MASMKVMIDGVETSIDDSKLAYFKDVLGATLIMGQPNETNNDDKNKSIQDMTVKELKSFLTENGEDFDDKLKKSDLLVLAELVSGE